MKDRQIEQLTAALVVAQQTAATAQALHAGTMQQQRLIDDVAEVELQDQRLSSHKSWWSRIFVR